METEKPRPGSLVEDPLVRMLGKKVPRLFGQCFIACVKYCADQMPKRVSLGGLGVLVAVMVFVLPRTITRILLYPIFRLVFGNLYPAYASYKAVRTKNVKEYVKWMMYWIVFALFTSAETFTDVFFSFWFPFYYEIKTILVIWLLSPATKGSSILYRRFVHPALIRREAEIDETLQRVTEQGYSAVLNLGSKGVNYATTVLMQTAIKLIEKADPNYVLPGSQSDSAISSLAKYPSTTTPTTELETDGTIATMPTEPSLGQLRLSASYEDFDPAEEATMLVEKSQETSVSDDEEYFKVPSKKSRGRVAKKTARGAARRLRSRSRMNTVDLAKYSDDEPDAFRDAPLVGEQRA